MSQTIPNNVLVAAADGGKARLFRDAGHEQKIRLHGDAHLASWSFADEGPSGSHDHLVLAADPQTRGQLRDAMSKAVADSTVFSVARVLTSHPARDVADALG